MTEAQTRQTVSSINPVRVSSRLQVGCQRQPLNSLTRIRFFNMLLRNKASTRTRLNFRLSKGSTKHAPNWTSHCSSLPLTSTPRSVLIAWDAAVSVSIINTEIPTPSDHFFLATRSHAPLSILSPSKPFLFQYDLDICHPWSTPTYKIGLIQWRISEIVSRRKPNTYLYYCVDWLDSTFFCLLSLDCSRYNKNKYRPPFSDYWCFLCFYLFPCRLLPSLSHLLKRTRKIHTGKWEHLPITAITQPQRFLKCTCKIGAST